MSGKHLILEIVVRTIHFFFEKYQFILPVVALVVVAQSKNAGTSKEVSWYRTALLSEAIRTVKNFGLTKVW